jgi:hypothetical protein
MTSINANKQETVEGYAYPDVYLGSNELEQQPVTQILLQAPHHPDANVHCGVSGWYNLDIAILRNSQFVVIVDINENVKKLYELTQKILAQSDDIDSFVTNFTKALSTQPFKVREADIEKIRKKSFLWLQTPENFHKTKKMFEEKRCTAMVGTLSNPNTAQKIQSHLLEQGFAKGCIDTFYASNVADWLIEGDGHELYGEDKMLKSLYEDNPHMMTIDSEGTMAPTCPESKEVSYHPIVRKITDKQPTVLTQTRVSLVGWGVKSTQIRLTAKKAEATTTSC